MSDLVSNPEEALKQIRKGSTTCFYRLDSALCHDKQFLLQLFEISTSPEYFYLASSALQNDRDFLEKIITESRFSTMFMFFSDFYKNDPDLATRAIFQNNDNVAHISESLSKNKEFMEQLLAENAGLRHIIKRAEKAPLIIDNEDDAIQAINTKGAAVYNQCSTSLQNNPLVMQAALQNFPAGFMSIYGMSELFQSISVRANCILTQSNTQKRLRFPIQHTSLLESVNLLALEQLHKDLKQAKNSADDTKLVAALPHKKPLRI